MNPAPEIIIFGASHTSIRLAERLAGQSRRVLAIDRADRAPEAIRGCDYASSDFAVPADIGQARLVYVVTFDAASQAAVQKP